MTSSAALMWFLLLSTSVCLLAEAQQSLPAAGQTAFDEIVVESTLFVKGKTGRLGKSRTLESVSTESSAQSAERPKRDAHLYQKPMNSTKSDEASHAYDGKNTNDSPLEAVGMIPNASQMFRDSPEEEETARSNSLRDISSDHMFA